MERKEPRIRYNMKLKEVYWGEEIEEGLKMREREECGGGSKEQGQRERESLRERERESSRERETESLREEWCEEKREKKICWE